MNSDKITENEDIIIEEHVAITREDAFEFLFTNEKLQNFVKQHNMIFIDGYFVIAAPKYIERSQDGKNARIQLTKWARENLPYLKNLRRPSTTLEDVERLIDAKLNAQITMSAK